MNFWNTCQQEVSIELDAALVIDLSSHLHSLGTFLVRGPSVLALFNVHVHLYISHKLSAGRRWP